MDTQEQNTQQKNPPPPASSEQVARAAHTKAPRSTRTQWVKATRVGYYDLERKREGAEFLIDPREYGTGWMVAITERGGAEDVERSEALAQAANATRIEAAATRLQDRNLYNGVSMQRDPKEVIQERVEAGKRLRQAAGIEERSTEPEVGDKATNQGALKRGDITHPDTGSAPSSGIGTNLNPAPYGQEKVEKSAPAGKTVSNKNVLG